MDQPISNLKVLILMKNNMKPKIKIKETNNSNRFLKLANEYLYKSNNKTFI